MKKYLYAKEHRTGDWAIYKLDEHRYKLIQSFYSKTYYTKWSEELDSDINVFPTHYTFISADNLEDFFIDLL